MKYFSWEEMNVNHPYRIIINIRSLIVCAFNLSKSSQIALIESIEIRKSGYSISNLFFFYLRWARIELSIFFC